MGENEIEPVESYYTMGQIQQEANQTVFHKGT